MSGVSSSTRVPTTALPPPYTPNATPNAPAPQSVPASSENSTNLNAAPAGLPSKGPLVIRPLRPTADQSRAAATTFDQMGLSRKHLSLQREMRKNDAIVLFANNALMQAKGGTTKDEKGKSVKTSLADEAAVFIRKYVQVKSTADSDGVDVYKPDDSGGLSKMDNITPDSAKGQHFRNFISDESFEHENQLSTPVRSIITKQPQNVVFEDERGHQEPAGIDLLVVTNGLPHGSANNATGEDSLSHFASVVKDITTTREGERPVNVDVYVVTGDKKVAQQYQSALNGIANAHAWDDAGQTAKSFNLTGLVNKKKYTEELHALTVASHAQPRAVRDAQYS